MASRREQEIRRQKRQDFQDRRRYNRIVQQLNQQKAEEQAAQAAATTTPTGTATSTDPNTLTGANDPAARAGLEGNFIPSKAGQTLPVWYQGAQSRTPAARKGLQGTGSGLPAWMPAWMNRNNLARGLTGLGVASSLMPMFGGTLSPAFMSLARLARGNQPGTTPQFGSLFNRNVSADTGMPDFPMLTQTGPQINFGGSGAWWNSKRRRGGGGRPRPQQPGTTYQPTYQDYEDDPAWAGRGLANWSIG